MTPQWERLQTPPGDFGPQLMDAVLAPNRSLSRKWFHRILIALCALDLFLGVLFWTKGAHPVVGFIVLEVVLFWGAFQLNYAGGKSRERVRVSPARILVSREPAFGAHDLWQVSPVWAQISQDEAAVRIASAGRALRIGAFLSPPERSAFARARKEAVSRARVTRPNQEP